MNKKPYFFRSSNKSLFITFEELRNKDFSMQIFSSTESLTLFSFIGIIFSVYQNFVNNECSFLSEYIYKQKSNSNTRINTFDAKSSRVLKKSHILK